MTKDYNIDKGDRNMALDNDKLREVYSTLRGGGYEDDYGTFVEGFTGDGNYANRKAVYELLRDNGADVGDTYEEFMGLMQSARRTGSDSGSGDGSARATDGSENSECSENSEGGSGSLVAAARVRLRRTRRAVSAWR